MLGLLESPGVRRRIVLAAAISLAIIPSWKGIFLPVVAGSYLIPDRGDQAAGRTPQTVGSDAALTIPHPCDASDPTDDTDISRITPSWALINPGPQLATGRVVSAPGPFGWIDGAFVRDSDLAFNHSSHDLDIFLRPDTGSRGLLASGNLLEPGKPEIGSLEVEWETGRFEGQGGLEWFLRDRGPFLLPWFIWPSGGDRVQVMGQWIFDCGHVYGDSRASYNYRSEIHPPQWMVVTRGVRSIPMNGTSNTGGSLLSGAEPATGGQKTLTDRPVVRHDLYANDSAPRSWEMELCNEAGRSHDFIISGRCDPGNPTRPALTDIDVDLYPPGTRYDDWGVPMAQRPTPGATVDYRFVDQGRGSLDPAWVTKLPDHLHVHVPLRYLQLTGVHEWGGSLDVFWQTGSPQQVPGQYVAWIDGIATEASGDVFNCDAWVPGAGGEWRLWGNVSGEWQTIFDQDGVCGPIHGDDRHRNVYPIHKAFHFAEPLGGAPLKIWISGYEADHEDDCFGGTFDVSCLIDVSDNPGMMQRTFTNAEEAAKAGWDFSFQASRMGQDEPGELSTTQIDRTPIYQVSYVVQPERIFNSAHSTAEFLGPDIRSQNGVAVIGPSDFIRLWEPGAQFFPTTYMEYLVWKDGDPEPDFASNSLTSFAAPFDLTPGTGALSSLHPGLYHLKFIATFVTTKEGEDRALRVPPVYQTVDFYYDSTPPQTTLSVGSPQYLPSSPQPFVTTGTPFALTATDVDSGVASISYRFFLEGTRPPNYVTSPAASASFTIKGPDGSYEIDYQATDTGGNTEVAHRQFVYLDNSPPVVTISQPASVEYVHSQTVILNYSADDGPGSGMRALTTSLDGADNLSGHGLTNGQPINLLLELGLGAHTFAVRARDNLGNSTSSTVTFTIIVTPKSIQDDLDQFISDGKLKNVGFANSLRSKLEAAAAANSRGNCRAATNLYKAFINELAAQIGKGVEVRAGDTMTSDAQFLISACG